MLRLCARVFLFIALECTYLLINSLALSLGCIGHRLPPQYVSISPEGQSEGSHCWMVIHNSVTGENVCYLFSCCKTHLKLGFLYILYMVLTCFDCPYCICFCGYGGVV